MKGETGSTSLAVGSSEWMCVQGRGKKSRLGRSSLGSLLVWRFPATLIIVPGSESAHQRATCSGNHVNPVLL